MMSTHELMPSQITILSNMITETNASLNQTIIQVNVLSEKMANLTKIFEDLIMRCDKRDAELSIKLLELNDKNVKLYLDNGTLNTDNKWLKQLLKQLFLPVCSLLLAAFGWVGKELYVYKEENIERRAENQHMSLEITEIKNQLTIGHKKL